MGTFNNIVVPVDFSETSDEAWRVACGHRGRVRRPPAPAARSPESHPSRAGPPKRWRWISMRSRANG